MVEYLKLFIRWKYVREAMAGIVLKKVNGKKKFLYKQNRYLSYPLKRTFRNTLINHIKTLPVALGIHICQYHWKLVTDNSEFLY